jgi:hypothetical protein
MDKEAVYSEVYYWLSSLFRYHVVCLHKELLHVCPRGWSFCLNTLKYLEETGTFFNVFTKIRYKSHSKHFVSKTNLNVSAFLSESV